MPIEFGFILQRLAAMAAHDASLRMLQFIGEPNRPALCLLLLHDDVDREFDYTAGAERALERARTDGWTVVSIANDWKEVFSAA
jgi:hypothetical protein